MIRNYLKGTVGDAINVMLSAAAMNFKRMMNKWKEQLVFWVIKITALFLFLQQPIAPRKVKMTF